MSNVIINGKEFAPHISGEQISRAVSDVARSIDEYYRSVDRPIVLVVTLSGAMIFAADLVRQLNTPTEWTFVKCSSYGDTLSSCGSVRFDVPLLADIEGRDVLVVEDIVDSGNTWEALHAYLSERNPRSLKIATFAIKKEVYTKSLAVDFVAIEIENKFAIGYGLDYAQQGRNLDGIYMPTSC